jgi:tetratricopeptide (TPR) repeat protein
MEEEEEDDDEILNYFKKNPLFMKEIPKNPEENELLSAMIHIDDEGTPEECAENWKHRGNYEFKTGKYRWDAAIDCYSQAINQNSSDKKAVSIYYSNRAAVNLSYGNFKKVIEDCQEAINLDEKNIKAYWRATKAFFYLDKLEDALIFCNKGLKLSFIKKKYVIIKYFP